MKTTRTDPAPVPYLGADLTDRYAVGCKPVDVCGLTPGPDDALAAEFWIWEWDPGGAPLDVGPLVPELSPGATAMFDGPQGLAAPPARMRECERLVGAAGKTPCERPKADAERPFAGFVLSGLDLFDALDRVGVPLVSSAAPDGRIGEVYPGDLWPLLAGPGLSAGHALPKKTRRVGWDIRRALLEATGVRFGASLITGNHDQLDACLAAVVAAAHRGAVPGLRAEPAGTPVSRDNSGGLREGEMYRLGVASDRLAAAIRDVLQSFAADFVRVGAGRTPRRGWSASAGVTRAAASRERVDRAIEWISESGATAPAERAAALLSWLITESGAASNDPVVLGYGAAWRLILPDREYPANRGPNAWGDVVELAAATDLQCLPGFGAVRLDTFIVNTKGRPFRPGTGHWSGAEYTEEDWLRAFGSAVLLRSSDVPAAGPNADD